MHMLRLTLKKNLIILSSLMIIGCTPTVQLGGSKETVKYCPTYCHEWNKEEKADIRKADQELNPESALHMVIRDYERVCITLASH